MVAFRLRLGPPCSGSGKSRVSFCCDPGRPNVILIQHVPGWTKAELRAPGRVTGFIRWPASFPVPAPSPRLLTDPRPLSTFRYNPHRNRSCGDSRHRLHQPVAVDGMSTRTYTAAHFADMPKTKFKVPSHGLRDRDRPHRLGRPHRRPGVRTMGARIRDAVVPGRGSCSASRKRAGHPRLRQPPVFVVLVPQGVALAHRRGRRHRPGQVPHPLNSDATQGVTES